MCVRARGPWSFSPIGLVRSRRRLQVVSIGGSVGQPRGGAWERRAKAQILLFYENEGDDDPVRPVPPQYSKTTIVAGWA